MRTSEERKRKLVYVNIELFSHASTMTGFGQGIGGFGQGIYILL